MVNRENELIVLRKKIFITGYKGGMAHLASCFSCIEMLYALYCEGVLRYKKDDAKWCDRDRFILSKGHAGLALYSVLNYIGLIDDEKFNSYLMENAQIGGEPCMRDSEWIEATTGSLGHGMSMAVGVALGLKMNNSPARVYCMLGDGECEEGTVWEGFMSASTFGLGNLIAILDCNDIQKMDFVEKIMGTTMWKVRLESFGWNIVEVDGHNIDEFVTALKSIEDKGRPTFVIAHTIKGKGVSIMENNPNWHFRLPGRKELKVFKEELGIVDEELV